ncbi:MAG: Rne/Rng family ribonuclease [Rhodospirillales bacterium]|nr:Rne/Rng family ribonuclease [Rhodospirillales bacterium]
MTTKRMLIDAAHPEETRVAVIDWDRLVDYDVEVASRRQLKGNIYLAKVTRVEPSLQAAFVEYGGNRHGFLAFNEIHPDYYQIPVADREALLAEQAAADRAEDAATEAAHETAPEASEASEAPEVETVEAADDEDEIGVRKPRTSTRHYKIQEVIKRRQIMLVQVTKEERGNKGAALTTYLSLAGRYCVLMPNTTRGGGISRKITNLVDRKRLKKIVAELGLPEGMAVILRTAGSERSKAEVRRDYDYLLRLWSNIRELTLTSMAPALVYEEGSLIKRSIRDLYDRLTDEILIEGEPAYRTAKDFMKLFIPSHARRVKLYEDRKRPLFQSFKVEDELEEMHQPVVQLKSGGSIVLNPTEALVAIDVNSGRATRERHIEETALRTNLEACDEVARQLRLRDLAGLIVVDFIDMENTRNQGQVERRFKEAMKNDRARIQLGRISAFGLLELSRQRLRPSLFETSFQICPHCAGAGIRRTTESLALAVLRHIEQHALAGVSTTICARVSLAVASYLLNQKRRMLSDLEARFGVTVTVTGDDTLMASDYAIDCSGPPPSPGAVPIVAAEARGEAEARRLIDAEDEIETADEAEAETEAETGTAADQQPDERGDDGKRGRRRRPRRRKRTDGEAEAIAAEARTGEDRSDDEEQAAAASDGGEQEPEAEDASERDDGADEDDAEKAARKRRRRGKRGGRRRARKATADEAGGEGDEADSGLEGPELPDPSELTVEAAPGAEAQQEGEPEHEGEPKHEAAAAIAYGADDAGNVAALDAESDASVGNETDERIGGHDDLETAPLDATETSPEDVTRPDEAATAGDPDAVQDDEAPASEDVPADPASAAEQPDDPDAGADWPSEPPHPVDDSGENVGDANEPEGAEPEGAEPDANDARETSGADAGDNGDPDSESEREKLEMRRTVVINVGNEGAHGHESRRTGWWQRFMS